MTLKTKNQKKSNYSATISQRLLLLNTFVSICVICKQMRCFLFVSTWKCQMSKQQSCFKRSKNEYRLNTAKDFKTDLTTQRSKMLNSN